jgi:SH3-like domain-containing protein
MNNIVINIILSGCGSTTSKSTAESAPVPIKPSEMPKDMAVVTDTTLDVYKEPSTTSERVTQALFNQGLKVLAIKDSWSNVKAIDGYTGWVKTKSINFDCSSINASIYKYRIIITTKVKTISTEFQGNFTAATAVMGTELYSNNIEDGWYEVYLPEGKKGSMDQSGCIQISSHK